MKCANRSLARGLLRLCCLIFLLDLAHPTASGAEPIPVRYFEGISRGFLLVENDRGGQVGLGDVQQVVKGDRIVNHLSIRFKDGSRYEDETVFTQQRVFQLVSDHVTEEGPIFTNPMETFIDVAAGRVSVRYMEHGKKKQLTKQMELPPDLANGMIYALVKNISSASETTVSYLAVSPAPRLVKLVFGPDGETNFAVGGSNYKATQYVMKVEIGGVAGLIAPILGKQPPDTHMWVIGGMAPTYAGSEGPLYGGGPVWKISLISPSMRAEH